jgi:hypothetical protein
MAEKTLIDDEPGSGAQDGLGSHEIVASIKQGQLFSREEMR